MSDKIKVSTDHLDKLASQLNSLASKLGSASNKLSGTYMNSTTANHTLRDGSCRLSGKAGVSRVSLGSTYSTVRRYSNVLDEYDDLCRKMAKEIVSVKERFIAIEGEISALANDDADEIGDILGFPKKIAEWTIKQWNKYLDFTKGYKNYDFPSGGKLYVKDGHFIYMDAKGNKSEYDFGDFLFHNNPFRTGAFELKEGVFGAYAISGLLLGNNEGGDDKGFWDNWKVKTDSSILLDKDKNDDRQKGLLTNSKGDKVTELKKQKKGKNGKWEETDKDMVKAKHTFAEVGITNSDYGGLAMIEGGIQGKDGYIKGKAAVGYGEYDMGVYGGLYGYDKDGKVVLAPGVRAEIGGSVSLLHADAEGSYDFGMIEVGASGSVDVAKVGGKGEVQLGWVDGKFAANAGVEAEALLFEAKGSVSGGNDYVGVKATGSVQVGVGVSADVGYHDGVFSLELGAALGIGFSGKVELDLGGTIDAVSDAAVSIAEGAADLYNGAKKGIQAGLKKLGKLFG